MLGSPSMTDIAIRDANPEDHDRIAAILLRAYAEHFPPDGAELTEEERAAWDGYRVDIAGVAARAQESVQIVALQGGDIVGSVTYYPPRVAGGAAAHYPGGEHAEGWPPDWAAFRLLGVDPSARGLGLGRVLTEECIRRSRAAHAASIGLHTTDVMKVARAMYERMGFVRVPEFDFYPMKDFCVAAYKLDLTP